jgi:RimJ/RimL family protein N-acetyltransferase
MDAPFLKGERVYLRAFEPGDATLLHRWINDEEVTRTLAAYRPFTLNQELEYIERMATSERDVSLGIVERGEGRLIGTAALHQIDWKNRHASFGILIGSPADRGRGWGSEATRLIVRYGLRRLNLNRIWLYVYAGNDGALKAYERSGFQVEGRLRQQHFGHGAYEDTLVMGVLADDPGAPR